jgi:hypothetical protein
MSGKERPVIQKRESVLVLIHHRRFDFALRDPAEQAGVLHRSMLAQKFREGGIIRSRMQAVPANSRPGLFGSD